MQSTQAAQAPTLTTRTAPATQILTTPLAASSTNILDSPSSHSTWQALATCLKFQPTLPLQSTHASTACPALSSLSSVDTTSNCRMLLMPTLNPSSHATYGPHFSCSFFMRHTACLKNHERLPNFCYISQAPANAASPNLCCCCNSFLFMRRDKRKPQASAPSRRHASDPASPACFFPYESSPCSMPKLLLMLPAYSSHTSQAPAPCLSFAHVACLPLPIRQQAQPTLPAKFLLMMHDSSPQVIQAIAACFNLPSFCLALSSSVDATGACSIMNSISFGRRDESQQQPQPAGRKLQLHAVEDPASLLPLQSTGAKQRASSPSLALSAPVDATGTSSMLQLHGQLPSLTQSTQACFSCCLLPHLLPVRRITTKHIAAPASTAHFFLFCPRMPQPLPLQSSGRWVTCCHKLVHKLPYQRQQVDAE